MGSLTQTQIIKRQAVDQIKSVFKSFGITDYYESETKLISPCPIHNGDNFNAFNINIDPSSEYYGCWFCNSHKCHEDYSNDIIGLTQGILSSKTSNEVDFITALQYLKGIVVDNHQTYYANSTNIIDSRIDKIFYASKENGQICTKSKVRADLQIPCDFYINRGFSDKALIEFDVGYCNKMGKQMSGRTVFPVYDKTGEFMIGAVGRAHDDRGDKWTNSKGFNTGSCLYNYHKAFDTIKTLGSVVLVEGQGDVIRMYEAGIINCVGLFSCKLTDRQAILLEEASVDTIYLALDNDEAGKKGRADISEKFNGIFNIRNLEFSANDVGDMSPAMIQEEIIPQMR